MRARSTAATTTTTASRIWLAGGGVQGGHVYGATDEFGFKAVENPVHVHDLHATMLHLLGFDHEKLTYRYAGRDFRLTEAPPSDEKAVAASRHLPEKVIHERRLADAGLSRQADDRAAAGCGCGERSARGFQLCQALDNGANRGRLHSANAPAVRSDVLSVLATSSADGRNWGFLLSMASTRLESATGTSGLTRRRRNDGGRGNGAQCFGQGIGIKGMPAGEQKIGDDPQ